MYEETFNEINKTFQMFEFIGIILLILIYIVTSKFLNNYNYEVYGKKSIISWIPIFRVYLLGKLVVNNYVGIILFLMLIFNIVNSFIIITSKFLILPTWIFIIYVLFFLYGWAIIKYSKLKSNSAKKNISNYRQQFYKEIQNANNVYEYQKEDDMKPKHDYYNN